MLRHTFVTTMLDAGVDLRDVQIAARHADPRTTMRYDRARKNLDRQPQLHPGRLHGLRHLTSPAPPAAQAGERPALPNSARWLTASLCTGRNDHLTLQPAGLLCILQPGGSASAGAQPGMSGRPIKGAREVTRRHGSMRQPGAAAGMISAWVSVPGVPWCPGRR